MADHLDDLGSFDLVIVCKSIQQLLCKVLLRLLQGAAYRHRNLAERLT